MWQTSSLVIHSRAVVMAVDGRKMQKRTIIVSNVISGAIIFGCE